MHSPGKADLNVYAYVGGHVLKNTDPLGLAETATESTCATSQCDGPAENVTLPPPKEPLTLAEVMIEGKVAQRTGHPQAARQAEARETPPGELLGDSFEEAYSPGYVAGKDLARTAL